MTLPRASTSLAKRRCFLRTTAKQVQHEKARIATSRCALSPLTRPYCTFGFRVHYRRSSSSQSRVGSPRFLPSPSETNPSEPPPANVKRRGSGPAGYRIHRLTFSAQPAKDQEAEGTGGARPHTAPPARRVHVRRCASNATALDTPAPRPRPMEKHGVNRCTCRRLHLRTTNPVLAAGPSERKKRRWS
ncbi:hypothetical protein EDB83DRAFT_437277 [Lactarius deliciosus]|nr:hypothetical protein EDB83DRAFT_437277 [Lactarius deliciosus]